MASSITLKNGQPMPVLGLGTWTWWQSKPEEVKNAVKHAIHAGYRHVDCAHIYRNEVEIGEALKEVVAEGVVTRDELFIVSKLWNTKHAACDVKASLMETLRSLAVDYLDLYLIHWPVAFKSGDEQFPNDEHGKLIQSDVHYVETWKAMEECVDEGLVRYIGLSNFNSQQIRDVLDHCRIKPAMLQAEMYPYFHQVKLLKYCEENGISFTAYSPFGAPNRPAWPPGTQVQEVHVFDDPKIVLVAAKHHKTPAQVILRWLIQKNVAVIPKSVTPSRIQENLQIFDFELGSEDMKLMATLDQNQRLHMVDFFNHLLHYPFNADF